MTTRTTSTSTVEPQFAQIFERKNQTVEKAKQHSSQLDQRIASKLLIKGISPPSWVWSPQLPSQFQNTSEVDKDELVSGLLLSYPQPAISCSSSRFSFHNNGGETADNWGQQNDSFVEVRASNIGLDAGEEQSVGAVNVFDPIPEQETSIVSPNYLNDATESYKCPGQSQSLVKIQRSKSRQKALEQRNSGKAAKSCSRDGNNAITVAITGPGIALLHSDNPNVSDFFEPVEINNEEAAAEEKVDDSANKEKDSSFSFGIVTRSRSSYHQANSSKEALSVGTSSNVVCESDKTVAQNNGNSINTSNLATESLEPPNRSSISNEKTEEGGDRMAGYGSKEKRNSIPRREESLRSSSGEPGIVIGSLKTYTSKSCKEDNASKTLQEAIVVSEIDQLVRSSHSPLDEHVFKERDGRENPSFTFKHSDVGSEVGHSHQPSDSKRNDLQQQDSAKAGTSHLCDEINTDTGTGRSPGSQIAHLLADHLGELELSDPIQIDNNRSSMVETIDSFPRKRRSGNMLSRRSKRLRTFGQQTSSAKESLHEGNSSNVASENDVGLAELCPLENDNYIVEDARRGDYGTKERGSSVSCRIARSESLHPDCINGFSMSNSLCDGEKKIGSRKSLLVRNQDSLSMELNEGERDYRSSKKQSDYSSRITRSRSLAQQCSSAVAALDLSNPFSDRKDKDGILPQFIGKSTQTQPSNHAAEGLEQLNPLPNSNEISVVEDTKIGECRSTDGGRNTSCGILRSRSSGLQPDCGNESVMNGSFSSKGKKNCLSESSEEPENVGKIKESVEKKIENCHSKENGSNPYSGRSTRSRASVKQLSFEVANMGVSTSYLANENDQELAHSISKSTQASSCKNEALKQINLSPTINGNSILKEAEVGDSRMNEDKNISAISTRSGTFNLQTGSVNKSPKHGSIISNGNEIGLNESCQDAKTFDDLKDLVEDKVDCCQSKERGSSVHSGRITRSRTSGREPTFAKDISSMDDPEITYANNQTFAQTIGKTAQASSGGTGFMEQFNHSHISNEGAEAEGRQNRWKENDRSSFGIRRKSGSSSLQPGYTSEILEAGYFSSNTKQDGRGESLQKPDHVIQVTELVGSLYKPLDEQISDENDGDASPHLASMHTDVVTRNCGTPPVYESFVMSADDQDDQPYISGDGICLEKLDIPDGTLQSASLLEQLCKSAHLQTDLSHDLTSLEVFGAQGLHYPVPDSFLESTSSGPLSINEAAEENFMVTFNCLNKEVNHSHTHNGTSHSDFSPYPGGQSSMNDKKPCKSPVKKVWDSISSFSSSSGKKRTLNLELPSIKEENENADAVAETFQEGIGFDVTTNSEKREPFADITEKILPAAVVEETYMNVDRSSLDSVNTHTKFTSTSKKREQRFPSQTGKGRGSSRLGEKHNMSLGASVKRSGGLLNNRLSKPRVFGKTSLKGDRSYSKKGSKPNNIVSNVTSFIPLVQKKQATAVATGKRDIKVKALETAEAAKRLAEKKDNERKMKKEAMKLERARQEQENKRQLELQRKKKEEERKKKEAEMAARKRQREEEERREKGKKRKRAEEVRKQVRGDEEKKLCAEKENKDLDFSSTVGMAHSGNELKDLGGVKVQNLTGTEPRRSGGTECDAEHSCSASDNHRGSSMARNNAQAGSGTNVASDIDNLVMNDVKEPSYEMSPFQFSEDEDEDDESPRKYIPPWASKSSLRMAIASISKINPDVLFPQESFCHINEVCLPRKLQQL